MGTYIQTRENAEKKMKEADAKMQAAAEAKHRAVAKLRDAQEEGHYAEADLAKAQKEQEEQEAIADARFDAAGSSRPAAAVRRSVSRSVPALAAFTRQLSTTIQSAVPRPNSAVDNHLGEGVAEHAAGGDPKADGSGAGAKRWRKVSAAFSLMR